MRCTIRTLVAFGLLLPAFLFAVTPLPAQVQFITPATVVPAPAAALTPPAAPSEIPSVLERGLLFERGRRWGEALTLYEDALRVYPRDTTLEQRFSPKTKSGTWFRLTKLRLLLAIAKKFEP